MQNQSFIIQKNTVDNFFKMERNIRLFRDGRCCKYNGTFY